MKNRFDAWSFFERYLQVSNDSQAVEYMQMFCNECIWVAGETLSAKPASKKTILIIIFMHSLYYVLFSLEEALIIFKMESTNQMTTSTMQQQ